jgi:hypothetical protein
MIRRRRQQHPRQGERGVTMILVVLAMLSMLGIVALAIDIITLYSARSEAQRAADSAALAGAKMLVDMGVTTDPTISVPTVAQIDAATKAARDVASKASIAGRAVQVADVAVSFPGSGTPTFAVNPQVSITVQNTNLPTFFSRIWSRAALTVRATALAEGFNPSNSSSIGGVGAPGIPVIARCVKPFVIPNCDPQHAGAGCGGTGATFFDPVSGAITNPGTAPAGIIGETFQMFSNCGPGPGCAPGAPDASPGAGGVTLRYYPAQMPAATNSCPAACGGGTNFENDTACCNPTPISCGLTVTLPAVNQLTIDGTVYPEGGGGPAQNGVECLIHQRPGNGQDNLNSTPLTYPLQISVGNNHPLAGTVLSASDLVTTSDSLVTVPVYDGATTPTAGGQVNIIGFLQVFIDQVYPGGGGPKAGEFQVTVVNVSGCGSSATGTAVASSSAVPVRLIH